MSLITGRIYRIICYCDPSINYIGSTTNTLRNRWQLHKSDYKKSKGSVSMHEYFDKYGVDNFKIILIKEYQVVDKSHLRAYEQLWINRTKCVNINSAFSITYLTAKLYKQTEKYKESQKQYYIKNYEIIKERNDDRKYHEYTCQCGSSLLWAGKVRHERSLKHTQYMSYT